VIGEACCGRGRPQDSRLDAGATLWRAALAGTGGGACPYAGTDRSETMPDWCGQERRDLRSPATTLVSRTSQR
jgi:hypothetical protein